LLEKEFNAFKSFISLQKKFCGGDKMVFSIEIPSKEEIKDVIKLAKNFPNSLDSKEIWILENYSSDLIWRRHRTMRTIIKNRKKVLI
jgi:hypothetical protein